jgi:carbon-monoxide dehydrogenase medium subunit
MRYFDLAEPKSLAEACAVLAENPEAKPMAGGTALLNLIKHGLYRPTTLVNLNKLEDGASITYDPRLGLRIGALARIYDVESSPLVQRHYPALAEACHLVANIRIRNMATIGGNLAHADYQSDPPTVLIALNAAVELSSRGGKRELQLSDFLRGAYETALETGELISALVVPPLPEGMRGVYLKFTTGSSEERPCAGVAALVQMENSVCHELRLVVGAVSAKPVRMHACETLAQGEKLTIELLAAIAAEASRSVDPIDDIRGPADYKRHLVEVLTRRAIGAAINEAEKKS